jgi:hypothetical protein
MKRQFQVFAMLLTALLAVGPALAAVACTVDNMAMGASCPMAEMSASCPMSQDLATTDCSQDCCNGSQAQLVVFPGVPVKQKGLAIAPQFDYLTAVATATPDSTSQIVTFPVVSSPPLHVLLRVFRI